MSMGSIVEFQQLTTLGKLRSRNKVIVFTNGAFDLLHVGHVRLLRHCKELGDVLVVGLNSDDSIRRYKSPTRPIYGEQERIEIVASLACVDYAVLFTEPDCALVLESLKPDIWARGPKSSDGHYQKELEVLSMHGGRHHVLPLQSDSSTSSTIDRICLLYH